MLLVVCYRGFLVIPAAIRSPAHWAMSETPDRKLRVAARRGADWRRMKVGFSLRELKRFAAEEPDARLFLMGHSDGATHLSHMLLDHAPELLESRVIGVALFSGFLRPDSIAQAPPGERPATYFSWGDEEELSTAARTRDFAAAAKKAGWPIITVPHSGGHFMRPDITRHAVDWAHGLLTSV